MRIALISTPWVAVPPPAYGGTEGVLDHLARALVEAGHEVLLFATGDSTCPVPKAWVYAEPAKPMGHAVAEANHIAAAYDAVEGFDIVHDHTIFGPLYAGRSPDLPVVTTIHNPFTPEARSIYIRIAEHAKIVAVSHDQRSRAQGVPVARVIHHGIHPGDFPMSPGGGEYLLFVGRMSHDKGVHHAVAVARKAQMPLTIAAKMREPEEYEYFHRWIEPELDSSVQYVGEAGRGELTELLGSAQALINPIRWPEPFGMVMIEAMAHGTPVIAFSQGSTPEIVDDGKTGFLCRDEDEMTHAVHRVEEIDRSECRKATHERFSAERMAAEHVDLYEEILQQSGQS